MQRVYCLGLLLALAGCVSTTDGSRGYGTYVYSDFLKPHGRERGNAAEQVATRACDGGVSDRIGTSRFDACMRARGWRLYKFQPAPQQPSPSYDVASDPGSPPSGPSPADDAAAASAAAAAAQAQANAAQDMANAAQAATVQTEYQFNTIYNAPN
jgi:hypothetical protein